MTENVAPLVSVVIPTYNHARFLGRALQSVLDQTYTHWEAIVIDNHSTDNTDEIMASFADPRIAYLKIHNNGVIAASRNAGIRAAKGEWVAFLDSDDWWTADKLQTCFDSIDGQVDLVYHDLQIVSDQPRRIRSKKIMKSWQVKAPVLIDLLVRGNAIATSSVVVRIKLLDQLNGMNESPEMVAAEDYNTWMCIAQLTDKFIYLPYNLGFYLTHSQGVSQKDMSIPGRAAASEFIRYLDEKQQMKLEANFRFTTGRFYYLLGNYIKANNNLWFAMLHGRSEIVIKCLWMIVMSQLLKTKLLLIK